MELTNSIRYVKGVGEKKAKLFEKLGVFTIGDLLTHFPREYEDRSELRLLRDVLPGECAFFEAEVDTSPKLHLIRRGMDILRFSVSDETAMCNVTFFNRGWIKDRIRVGDRFYFYGRFADDDAYNLSIVNPIFERITEKLEKRITGRIFPVYSLTAGLTQAAVADAVGNALAIVGDDIPDILPDGLRDKYLLQGAVTAYRNIHFPTDNDLLHDARRRLAFEELFLMTLGLRRIKAQRRDNGISIAVPQIDEFERLLPFKLTAAQRRSIEELYGDLSAGRPMNRLVQGDVGSGKTVVAAAAALAVCSAGFQAAIMAPTELLATQHFRSLEPLLSPAGLRVGLLTGSTTASKKGEIYAALEDGGLDLIVGTHALIVGEVKFRALGLAVTDEQHRFGVAQRMALAEKSGNEHVLVMSATPIPRTLALITYGDLDLSIIDELPPGRKPVKTYAVDGRYRQRLNAFIRKIVGEGRQVFVVCPLVEDTKDSLGDGRKAVEAYAATLKTETFPDLAVEFLHGKLKQKDKDKIMSRFSLGEVDILVATTVIEVGIDVPNAALMIVENAERFGLSQLHQLRGRIGRGEHDSYCVLVAGVEHMSATVKQRLAVMTETTDGFKIAEADLKLRGPGDFFGRRQHGLPLLKIADLVGDTEVLRLAVAAADEMLSTDAGLELPEHAALKDAIAHMFDETSSN